jgi:lysophospholipase L1-like esterase
MVGYNIVECWGDSLTAGNSAGNPFPHAPWPQHLQMIDPSRAYWNMGEGGLRTDQVLAKLVSRGPRGATHGLLCAGTNDGAQAIYPPSHALWNLRQIVLTMMAHDLEVIIMTIPPREGSPQYSEALQQWLDIVNTGIQEFAMDYWPAPLRIFDTRPVLGKAPDFRALSPAYAAPDLLHVSNAGNAVWAAALLTFLGPVT